MLRRRVQPAGVDRHQDQREHDRRDDQRRLAQRLRDRAPRDLADLRAQRGRSSRPLAATRGSAPRRPRPRACGRSWRGRRRRASARAAGSRRSRGPRRRARARPRRAPRRRRSAAPPPRPARAATGVAEALEHAGDRVAVARRSAGSTSSVGRPISAFSASGVPSATILPWSMIPMRSASTSASSRYCVVRKTVTPSSCASRATSCHMSARLCGSRPGGRLVEEQDARAVDERERQVEPALHAARVAADLAVGGVRQADALEQLVAARRGARPRRRPAAWSAGACARGRSGAGRAPPPGARRRSRGAPRGPRARCRDPPTRARARGGRQQRREHQHGGRLAGAVRPEEAVDLAGLDRRGRCRRRRAMPPLNSRTRPSTSMPLGRIVIGLCGSENS